MPRSIPLALLPLIACIELPFGPGPAPAPGAYLVFPDADQDGYGDASATGEWVRQGDEVPAEHVRDARDCDDADAAVSPDSGCACPKAAQVAGQDFSAVEDALSAVPDGHIVYVCPGDHEVNGTIGVDSLRVESWTGDAGDTELRGGNTHRILRGSAAFLELLGLTFADGYAGYDGGAITVSASRMIVRDSTFRDNTADYEGGAIAYSTGRGSGILTIERSTFLGNWAGYEGGAISHGYQGDSQLVITDSVFSDNYADYEGGAVSASSARDKFVDVQVSGTAFQDNVSGYEGGAIEVGSWGDGHAAFVECTFHRNVTQSGGGAVNTMSWGHIDVDSDRTDWGVGADDNAPHDLDGNGSLGESETFSCSSTEHDSNC